MNIATAADGGSLVALGHPFVQTPHLDRLVHDGVRFCHIYAASPVCAPGRVSFLTGIIERIHGIGFAASCQLTEAQWDRSYPARLRKAGYHTGFVRRFGVEYDTFKGRAAEMCDFRWAHDGWTKFVPKDDAPVDRPFCLSVSFNVSHGSQTTSMHTLCADWQRMSQPASGVSTAAHSFSKTGGYLASVC